MTYDDTDDTFVQEMALAYVECALWSSTATFEDGTDVPLDEDHTPDDIDAGSLAEMRNDVNDFFEANREDLRTMSPEQAGHDFWLTRNRHGAGFWDRGLGALGDRLTDAAHVYGESDLYVGDDGAVHVN